MKLLFAASEAAPFLKSGGLGDVLEALPARLAKREDIEVTVVLPLYKKIKRDPLLPLDFVTAFSMPNPLSEDYVGVLRFKCGEINFLFIDNEY